MRYFLHSEKDKIIYSIDKLVVKGKLNMRSDSNCFTFISGILFGNEMPTKYTVKDLPSCVIPLRYHDFFEITETVSNSKIIVQLGFNGLCKTEWSSYRITFNPNGISDPYMIWKLILDPIVQHSKDVYIDEMDIAFDFPHSIDNFFLVRDKRKKTTIDGGGSDRTEYLSKHHEHGFCKLYNKQQESKLDYLLTRFELTLRPDKKSNLIRAEDCLKVFPKLIVPSVTQTELGSLSSTYMWIVRACLMFPFLLSTLNQLNAHAAVDIRAELEKYNTEFKPDLDIVRMLISLAYSYIKEFHTEQEIVEYEWLPYLVYSRTVR